MKTKEALQNAAAPGTECGNKLGTNAVCQLLEGHDGPHAGHGFTWNRLPSDDTEFWPTPTATPSEIARLTGIPPALIWDV